MAKAKPRVMAFEPDIEFIKGLAAEGGWVTPTDVGVKAHIEHGYMTTDGELDDDGDVFVELTELGMANATAAGWVAPAPTSEGSYTPGTSISGMSPNFAHISADVDDDSPLLAPGRSPVSLSDRAKRPSPLRNALGFDALEIGQSRHIAVTDKTPEPWKSYASTVTIENSRYATPLFEEDGTTPKMIVRSTRSGKKPFPMYSFTKKFRIYRAGPHDPRGPGARLKRVDPND